MFFVQLRIAPQNPKTPLILALNCTFMKKILCTDRQ